MKKKLEIQTIIVLICVLAIAGAWIGIQITKDSLGVWSEAAELQFTSKDLLGLAPRSELRCAGASVGHVRRITPAIGPDGAAQFTLIAGVKKDYAAWKFAPVGIVKAGVVQSALAPSSITLELSAAPGAVQARLPKEGSPPVLPLEKEKSKNEIADVVEQYRKLGDQIDHTIRQFTEPQNGRSQSVMQELAEAIPAAASSMRQLEGVTASLNGQSLSKETDPAKRPPVEKLLANLDSTTANLRAMTASLEQKAGDNGKIDQTLKTLDSSLLRLQGLTDQMTKTVTNLNARVDTSILKVNGLLDETTGTMSALHNKVDGFGNTMVGRMLIAKPEKPAPAPARKKDR
jgi:ABC-type transporter Mla subunit MlaD